MKPRHQTSLATKAALFSTLGLSAMIACGSPGVDPQPSVQSTKTAIGTCGPGEMPNGIGVCESCPGLEVTTHAYTTTQANGTTGVDFILDSFVAISKAYYQVTNGSGQFEFGSSNLAAYHFTQPPPSPLTLPSTSGEEWPFSYTATPTVPSLSVTWSDWVGTSTGISIPALVSGTVDVHITGFGSVNPTLTITNLPVTVNFGTDASGNATVTTSQVVLPPSPSSYMNVSGCGVLGWCTSLVKGSIESNFTSALQSALASGFYNALNGVTGGASTPFWPSFLQQIAGVTSVLLDPDGNMLPSTTSHTPGGTPSGWLYIGDIAIANGQVTAGMSSGAGLCYIDCTPTQTTCGANNCGAVDDGCGDTIECGSCPAGDVCTNNQCTVCIPKTTCDGVTGCGGISDGCGGSLQCNTCGGGMVCQNGECVGTGGSSGSFCTQCRASGGICTTVGGKSTCVHE
jgi:hypothetical protein